MNNATPGGFRSFLVGIGSLTLLLGLLAGVPLALVILVGNPLPSNLPSWSEISDIIDSGTLPAGVLMKVVACFVWVWWFQAALSAVVEITARIGNRDARRLPLAGFGMQPLVVHLISAVIATLVGIGTLVQPAAASPSFDGVSVAVSVVEEPDSRQALEMAESEFSEAASVVVTEDYLRNIIRERLSLREPASIGEPTTAGEVAWGMGSPAWPLGRLLESASAAETTPDAIDRQGIVRTAPPPELEHARDNPASTIDSQGVVSTEDESLRAVVGAEAQWVIVQPGDTLWALAETHLGAGSRWDQIFELNEGILPSGGVLNHPNVIHPGWRLRLPVSTKEANEARSTPWDALAGAGLKESSSDSGERLATPQNPDDVSMASTPSPEVESDEDSRLLIDEEAQSKDSQAKEAHSGQNEVRPDLEAGTEAIETQGTQERGGVVPMLYPPTERAEEIEGRIGLEKDSDDVPKLFPPNTF